MFCGCSERTVNPQVLCMITDATSLKFSSDSCGCLVCQRMV